MSIPIGLSRYNHGSFVPLLRNRFGLHVLLGIPLILFSVLLLQKLRRCSTSKTRRWKRRSKRSWRRTTTPWRWRSWTPWSPTIMGTWLLERYTVLIHPCTLQSKLISDSILTVRTENLLRWIGPFWDGKKPLKKPYSVPYWHLCLSFHLCQHSRSTKCQVLTTSSLGFHTNIVKMEPLLIFNLQVILITLKRYSDLL